VEAVSQLAQVASGVEPAKQGYFPKFMSSLATCLGGLVLVFAFVSALSNFCGS
jgi:hypothetical protein